MRSTTYTALAIIGMLSQCSNFTSAEESFGKDAESTRLKGESRWLDNETASLNATRPWFEREQVGLNADAAKIRDKMMDLVKKRTSLNKINADIAYWDGRASQAWNQFQANGSMGAYSSISDFRSNSQKARELRNQVRQEMLDLVEQISAAERRYNVRNERYRQEAASFNGRIGVVNSRRQRYVDDSKDFNRRYVVGGGPSKVQSGNHN